MQPGQLFLKETDIICNVGRTASKLTVTNTGDRPVQVGSHFHFYEVNEALQFKREEAFGKRLNIPAGAAVRFEPGDEKEVELVPYAGERRVYGFNNKVDGSLEKEGNQS
ncbi:urease subunit beta [Bacillus licheniformis]|uniref:urease subunit beta n=1 Tax=Bacillus licheniformis TaxID=1402 RepID=UPI00092B987E|nr:urease subunit beta [Bacillus licheniformis]MCY7776558.1 urease subunit beta [Bacillus licheniformis]MCY7955213.1 urease subunit beta [Bacillus licheniformis]MCY8021551.1 urease subunit beta [Bacillus licheniformis]MCY8160493.1 urease subunit beta [Bacillus licheniformis]MCY8529674.1 urease subunit beta [Bacillus licheniformis]